MPGYQQVIEAVGELNDLLPPLSYIEILLQ